MSYIIKLLKEFPSIEWDWHEITMNSDITMSDVDNNISLNWKFHRLDANPNFEPWIVVKYPEKQWNYLDIVQGYEFEKDFLLHILGILGKYKFDGTYFMYPSYDSCTEYILQNELITMNDIDKNIKLLSNCIYAVHKNPNFDFWIVEKYPLLNWNWYYILESNKVKFQFSSIMPLMENYFEKINKKVGLNCSLSMGSNIFLSRNKNIRLSDVENNLDFNYWDWESISLRSDFSFSELFLEKVIDKNMNWTQLVLKNKVNPLFLVKHNIKNVDWDKLLECGKIDCNFINENKEKIGLSMVSYIDIREYIRSRYFDTSSSKIKCRVKLDNSVIKKISSYSFLYDKQMKRRNSLCIVKISDNYGVIHDIVKYIIYNFL